MASLPGHLDFPDSWNAELSRRTPLFKAWTEHVVQLPNVNFGWDAERLALLKAKLTDMAGKMH